ncbi:RHS repeat domain-containing protein, partial [uncultured Capnocytophaga sp.]|uniref:RHS repeat domain-containing protein n=1 Tax=uncultured Capnocytophaga sp. TaxID=159273 RepID=UPI0034D97648
RYPIEAYNQEGELIWEREQDLYGNSRQGFAKENFRCPFKYQGQYYDPEIELCYNRSDRIAKKSHKCNKKKNFKWKIEYLLNNYVIKDGMSKQ